MRTSRGLKREALLLSALCTIVLFGLTLVLISWRVEQLLTELHQQRLLRLTQQISQQAERAMRFGVSLSEQTAWLTQLEQLPQRNPQLLAVRLEASDGVAIAQTGNLRLPDRIAASWQRQLALTKQQNRPLIKTENDKIYLGRTLIDANGQNNATLWFIVDALPTQTKAQAAAMRIAAQVAPFLLLTLMLLWWALSRLGLQWQTQASASRRTTALTWIAALLCAATPATMVWSARETARPLVAQEIAENAEAIGHDLNQQITRALSYGIPLAQLHGVGELFRNTLQQAPELSYLALRTSTADELHVTRQAGHSDDIITLTADELPHGASVVVGYPANYVDRQLGAILLDLALALTVSVILLLECLRWRWQRNALAALLAQKLQQAGRKFFSSTPATAFNAANPEQMARLRLIIFLIALSEELLRPFFTVFSIDMPSLGMSPAMVAGLPVVAFMTMLALAQPAGPVLASRFDLRWSLLVSALAGSIALAATGQAESAPALAALRAFAGMAYGLALILAQTALVRITPPQQRARGMTQIAGAIVAAGIVGPPFGGMIAAQAGAAMGFAACALCMVLAACVSHGLQLPAPSTTATSATGGWRGYWAVLRNPRALSVIFCAALPARLVAVTVLVVIVPLQMDALQQPAAMTGKVLLLYFLLFAITVSLFASWSDSSRKRLPFVFAGGLVSALACWALPSLGGVTGMAICCALLGLGQAMQSSPQLALVTEIFEHRAGSQQLATPEQALAAFRLLERLGSIAAPFATAWAVSAFGYAGAMWAIGIFLAVATLGILRGRQHPVATPVALSFSRST